MIGISRCQKYGQMAVNGTTANCFTTNTTECPSHPTVRHPFGIHPITSIIIHAIDIHEIYHLRNFFRLFLFSFLNQPSWVRGYQELKSPWASIPSVK